MFEILFYYTLIEYVNSSMNVTICLQKKNDIISTRKNVAAGGYITINYFFNRWNKINAIETAKIEIIINKDVILLLKE